MTPDRLISSDWYRAATLAERAAGASGIPLTPNGALADRAGRRLRRWASQAPFTQAGFFTQRLAPDRVDEAGLLRLLGESPDDVRRRLITSPGWLDRFIECYAANRPGAEADKSDAPNILGLLDPLIRSGAARLRLAADKLVAEYPGAPIAPATVVGIFMPRLATQLFQLLSRTIALELNVARLQGTLRGETAEERFRDFIQTIAQPDLALVLLEEYAVLARLAVEWIDRWVDTTVEFLERLCLDWRAIRSTFGSGVPADNLGELLEVNQGAGDTHRGGRSVTVATFTNNFRIVYKPRSLSVETHFHELLAWVNDRGDHPEFRRLRILECDSYGWVEFVAQRPCSDGDEIERFFQRQGGYLALFYALEATDFHYENIIADGEHPIPIDLESLFHPQLNAPAAGKETPPVDEDRQALLRIGLLPLPREAMAEFAGLDLSGINAPSRQVTAKPVSQWDGVETDQMRIVRKVAVVEGSQNRPSFDGQELNAAEHVDAIVSGFTSVWRTLVRHRDELLADTGPVQRFAGDEVRVIMRATQVYAMLLSDSLHPDVLRDALDRDRLLDRLWVAVPNWSRLAEVVRREHDDLLRGDIPMFTTRPSSIDLLPAVGEPIRCFFDEPAVDHVRRRIIRMDEATLARQCEVIESSLAGSRRSDDPVMPVMVPLAV